MIRMDPPTASGECSSDSKSSSSAPRLGLEHPQRFGKANTDTVMAREMRKKRITFGHRHVDDPDTAPDETSSPAAEGILRRGRFAPKRPSMSSSYNPSSFPATPKRRRYHSLMVISAFGILSSGVAVAAYSLLGLGGQVLSSLTGRVPSRKLRGGSNGGGFDQMAAWLRAETAGMDPEERKRRLAVGRSVWPRCVTEKMSAIQCKTLIDEEVLQLNTGTDRFIRTIIVGKRAENDPLSNSVVLLLDDDNMVKGKNGDGLVYYDFKWDGSGNEATRYQQRKIPEIVANETTWEGSWTIEWNMVPIRTLGVTTHEAVYGSYTTLISGGVKTAGIEADTVEGETKLTAALSESATIEQAGKRTIGPFDCSGMTGHSCCLMIKHKVRDSDKKGRAIQCYTDYREDTEKHKALINSRGKKIFIFENHKGRISKDPKVVGDWPQGIADTEPDFHDWIQDGGGLSDGQMRLIHGEDWQPPGQI